MTTPPAVSDALSGLGKRALARWEELLARDNRRDFDAMVLDCRNALRSPSARPALEAIRSRFKLLIVDEFQDTDEAQRDIAFAIAGLDLPPGSGPTLFMVGDPKQSIYGFRGADIAVWNDVVSRIGEPLPLNRNFRSDPVVVDYVNRAAGSVMRETSAGVRAVVPANEVGWAELVPHRVASEAAGLEWLSAKGKAQERRDREAELVATRIRDLVVDHVAGDTKGAGVVDPDTGELRGRCVSRRGHPVPEWRRGAALCPGARPLGRPVLPGRQPGGWTSSLSWRTYLTCSGS